MLVYMLGNVGTHKSTLARYIADKFGMLLLDDDEIYYTISNKSWRYYYDKGVQEMVASMIYHAATDTHIDTLVCSCTVDLFKLKSGLDYTEQQQMKVVVTGNGTREYSLENRTKNGRGYPPEAWAKVWDREAIKINNLLGDDQARLKSIVPPTKILTLSDTLDIEKSKLEIDAFLLQPRWLNKL